MTLVNDDGVWSWVVSGAKERRGMEKKHKAKEGVDQGMGRLGF